MNTKRKTRKTKDFEAEREKLLATMEKHISKGTKSKIKAAVNAATKLDELKITVSHEGAADAHDK